MVVGLNGFGGASSDSARTNSVLTRMVLNCVNNAHIERLDKVIGDENSIGCTAITDQKKLIRELKYPSFHSVITDDPSSHLFVWSVSPFLMSKRARYAD